MDTYVLDYMVRTLINKIWILPVLIGLCFLSSAILVSADEVDFEDNDTWNEDLYIEPLEVVDEDPLPETSVEEPAQGSVEEPAQETSSDVTDQETTFEEPAQETSSDVTDQETTSAAESTQSPNTSIDGDPAVDDVTLHNDNILLTASLYVMSGLLVSMGLIKIML